MHETLKEFRKFFRTFVKASDIDRCDMGLTLSEMSEPVFEKYRGLLNSKLEIQQSLDELEKTGMYSGEAKQKIEKAKNELDIALTQSKRLMTIHQAMFVITNMYSLNEQCFTRFSIRKPYTIELCANNVRLLKGANIIYEYGVGECIIDREFFIEAVTSITGWKKKNHCVWF